MRRMFRWTTSCPKFQTAGIVMYSNIEVWVSTTDNGNLGANSMKHTYGSSGDSSFVVQYRNEKKTHASLTTTLHAGYWGEAHQLEDQPNANTCSTGMLHACTLTWTEGPGRGTNNQVELWPHSVKMWAMWWAGSLRSQSSKSFYYSVGTRARCRK